MKWTRKQYMAKECTHHEYYVQFADIFINAIKSTETKEQWIVLLEQDEHLNQEPKYWDKLSLVFSQSFANRNEAINGSQTWSQAGGVCAAKAAVRMYVEEQND